MPLRCGSDTSVLMRLLTGHSQEEYERCRRDLTQMVQENSAKIFASNHVIGEAYIALHHHYGISKPEARQALTSGLIGSLKGQACWRLCPSREVQDCSRQGSVTFGGQKGVVRLTFGLWV